MDITQFKRRSEYEWQLEPSGKMRVPAVVYADETLLMQMDEKVGWQLRNVAALPGIVKAAYAMPDAHWGYGFPIGGVAAFDANAGGVVSGGGVGFDISCGVRSMLTGLKRADILPLQTRLANSLFKSIPAGLGSEGAIRLNEQDMTAMLAGGAKWALRRGWGEADDLLRIEEGGSVQDARPEQISEQARRRQRGEMGTLGSGNHYCEVQVVDEIFNPELARGFGIANDDVLVTVHCGSRGLGHQVGTEFLRSMALTAHSHGIDLPDRELACAPILSDLGQCYLGAMRAAINCALANRQILGHLLRETFAELFPEARLTLLFDVSHNTCKLEKHVIEHKSRELYIHRKGATRAFCPGHPQLPDSLRPFGQPVLIGGSMGTESWILAGMSGSEARSFSSACHGAGRSMSRIAASKHWSGRKLVDDLATRGILIRSPSLRGVAEEAPGAYKDARAVVDITEKAGLARKVARLKPLICIKG
jgi:tRNA-splicing ligase RtcB